MLFVAPTLLSAAPPPPLPFPLSSLNTINWCDWLVTGWWAREAGGGGGGERGGGTRRVHQSLRGRGTWEQQRVHRFFLTGCDGVVAGGRRGRVGQGRRARRGGTPESSVGHGAVVGEGAVGLRPI